MAGFAVNGSMEFSNELRDRLRRAIDGSPGLLSDAELEDLLTAGYAQALALDAQGLRMERRITELAACAHDADAAQELRNLWLEHRTSERQLRELREMLSLLKRACH